MISRAIEIDPGSSSRDGESLLQSPCSSASRTSARVNHAASAISPSLNDELLLGVADARGSRPSATAGTATAGCPGSVTSVTVEPDLLGDLAHDARFERLARLDEAGQQREQPLAATPSGGPAPRGRAPSCTRQMTAGSMRGNSSWPLTGLTRDQPPLIGLVGDTVDRAEPRAVVPIQQRGRRRHQLRADVVEDRRRPGAGRAPRTRRRDPRAPPARRGPPTRACRRRAGRGTPRARPACRPVLGGLAEHHPAVGDQHLVAPVDPQQQRVGPAGRPRRRCRCAARRRGRRRPATAAGRCAAGTSSRRAALIGRRSALRMYSSRSPSSSASTSGASTRSSLPVAHHAEHDVGQVPRRAADLLGARPRARRSRIPRRGSAGPPSSRRRSASSSRCRAAGPRSPTDTTVESAPDCRSRCWFSASRTAAMILALGASSRAVSVTSTAVSSRLVATMIALACWAPASRSTSESVALAAHGHQPGALGALQRGRVVVDDDDVGRRDPVADHRGDGGPALGAVADDDGVVAHAAPPSLDLECLPRLRGQRLDRGTDQHDQERHPQRRDHQDVDQPRRRGERGDVAVAGGRQRHRRVVQAVQERQRSFVAVDVAVAVAVEVDDQHRGEQRRQRVDDAHGRSCAPG